MVIGRTFQADLVLAGNGHAASTALPAVGRQRNIQGVYSDSLWMSWFLDVLVFEDVLVFGHNAYLGKCSSQWLSKQLVFSLLGSDPNRAGKGYVNLMASDAETPAIVREGNESDSRLAGDDDFLARILGAETTSKGKGSLQEIVASYCTKESISQSELLAPGRKRKYSRARALIAIEAVGTGSVTVSELARLFNRTESAICQVMSRYGTVRKPPNNQ